MSQDIKITRELMKALGACHSAREYFTERNLWNRSENEVLQALVAANRHADIEWWNLQKRSANFVMHFEHQTGKYRVRNLSNDSFDACPTLEVAQEQALRNLQQYFAKQSHLFSVCSEEIDEKGNARWSVVDLRNAPKAARYFVFDPFTGNHHAVMSAEDAQSLRRELKLSYLNRIAPLFTIEQEVVSKVFDITAWLALPAAETGSHRFQLL